MTNKTAEDEKIIISTFDPLRVHKATKVENGEMNSEATETSEPVKRTPQ